MMTHAIAQDVEIYSRPLDDKHHLGFLSLIVRAMCTAPAAEPR